MLRALTVLLLFACSAQAENIHVDPNNPAGFATIAEALDEADDGDLIFVAEGAYFENITVDKSIHLIGAGADLVSLFAQSGNVITVTAGVDTNTVIEGMTVTAKGGNGIDMSSGGSATILRCVITRCQGVGILTQGSAAVIRGNQVTENVSNGIQASNDAGSIITNNIIKNHGTNYYGIFFYGSPGSAMCANNLFKANGYGIGCQGASPKIQNNVIVENGQGIWLRDSSPVIAGNIIADNGWGVNNTRNSVPAITYNDVSDNTSGDYSSLSPDAGEISKDPKFVNPGADDYHLQEGSPCIDAGIPGAAHADPDGSPNDMGMYGGPFVRFWEEPYTGPVITHIEVTPSRVQQGGTVTVRASGTTVLE